MQVYRIGETRFARELSGEGARLYGGRWNNPLIPCIYTSESRALAILEYSVNIDLNRIPRALSITTIEIPDKQIYTVNVEELPGDWKDAHVPTSTKNFGTQLLKNQKILVIKIPSVILPQEHNYLLNPLHIDSSKFKISDVDDFIYDVRIKKA